MEHVTEKRKSILDNVIETLRDAGVFNEGVHRKLSCVQIICIITIIFKILMQNLNHKLQVIHVHLILFFIRL
jgi:hypothetical protein